MDSAAAAATKPDYSKEIAAFVDALAIMCSQEARTNKLKASLDEETAKLKELNDKAQAAANELTQAVRANAVI